MLTQDQAAELIRAHRLGDKRALNRLAELSRGWLVTVSQRYVRRGLEFDDALQVAYMGFMRAIETYDPDRASWMSYVHGWARSALGLAADKTSIVQHQRKIRRPWVARLDAPLGGEQDFTLLDLLAAPEGERAFELDDEHLARLAALLDLLTRKERLVIERRLEGLCAEEIAQELGVAVVAVESYQRRALQRIRGTRK